MAISAIVENFLADDVNWDMRYLVIATHNWWPGKHVRLAPYAVKDIDWAGRRINRQCHARSSEIKPVLGPAGAGGPARRATIAPPLWLARLRLVGGPERAGLQLFSSASPVLISVGFLFRKPKRLGFDHAMPDGELPCRRHRDACRRCKRIFAFFFLSGSAGRTECRRYPTVRSVRGESQASNWRRRCGRTLRRSCRPPE